MNQGTLINSLEGTVSGGLAGTFPGALGAPDLAGAADGPAGLNFGAIIGQGAGGVVDGGGLLAIVGRVRNLLSKST